jgi:type II secretory pathway component PulF
MKIQFSYKATKNEKEINGYIAAISQEDAKKMLEELGYNVLTVEEAKIGRSNPFELYNTGSNSVENLQATEE